MNLPPLQAGIVQKGMPPLTDEELEELRVNKPKSDDEIDYSDIPKMTKEELSKFRPARLRQRKSENIAS